MPLPDAPCPATPVRSMRLVGPPVYFLPRGVSPPETGALPLAGLTVLLVEDSRFASDAMRLMCHRSGARLRRAETLEGARAHLRTYRPDVVIVDLGLPDGRGDRLIRDLVMARQGSVILGLSGDSEGRMLALAAGAMGFLEKPLPGLAAFQQALLRHLPGRFGGVAEAEAEDLAGGDPLALQDDLAHAAELLAACPDADQQRYLAAFLAGLARATGDTDMGEAARTYGADAAALPDLRRLVQAKLTLREVF